MSAAHDVTDATFADEVLIVDAPRSWSTSGRSGAARAAASRPILDEIATEHADKIKIVKLNVDDNPHTSVKYQITSIPAM